MKATEGDGGQGGGRPGVVIAVACDVAREPDVRRMTEDASGHFRRIDILYM